MFKVYEEPILQKLSSAFLKIYSFKEKRLTDKQLFLRSSDNPRSIGMDHPGWSLKKFPIYLVDVITIVYIYKDNQKLGIPDFLGHKLKKNPKFFIYSLLKLNNKPFYDAFFARWVQ